MVNEKLILLWKRKGWTDEQIKQHLLSLGQTLPPINTQEVLAPEKTYTYYADSSQDPRPKVKLKRNRLRNYTCYVGFKTCPEIFAKLQEQPNKSRFINKLLADYFGLRIFKLNAEIILKGGNQSK